MNEEFNKEELEIVGKLKDLKEEIVPSKSSFEKMLSSLPRQDNKYSVTNHDDFRYSFSMMKYAVPLVALVLIVGGVLFMKHNHSSLSTQTSEISQNQGVPTQNVTADNADSALSQTDQAIQQATDQMDQDLKAMDQSSSSEDDLNNI